MSGVWGGDTATIGERIGEAEQVKRTRRDRVFLVTATMAGLGGMVAVPFLAVFAASVILPWFGIQIPNFDDQRLTNWIFFGGMGVGLALGAIVYFLTSRSRDRRSAYHWWRLFRAYVVVLAPFVVSALPTLGFPMNAGLRVACWIFVIIPPLWLPDVYRRVAPRVRTGYYQRARWVRRNRVPRWCNAGIAAVVFVVIGCLLPAVFDGLWGWQMAVLTRGGGMREFSMWVILIGLVLAVPYVVARFVYSGMTWKLEDEAGHCRRCGYDLTKNASGRCPECGVQLARCNGMESPLKRAEGEREEG